MAGLKGQARLPQQRDPRVRRNAAGLSSDAEFLFSGAFTIVNGVITLAFGTNPALDQTSGLIVLLKTVGSGLKQDGPGLYVDSTVYLSVVTAAATYQVKPVAGTYFSRSFGVLAAAPGSGMVAGDTYYDSVLLNTFIYTGSAWKQIVVI
jgi:hypothetical protein